MPLDPSAAAPPAAALAFPLAVGVALLAAGGGALLAGTGRASDPDGTRRVDALSWIRLAAGALLLIASGPSFTVAAAVAVACCAAALRTSLDEFAHSAGADGALRVAGASALVAFASISAAAGLLGLDGVLVHLPRLSPDDLRWAAALVALSMTSTLLQLGAGQRSGPTAVPARRSSAAGHSATR